MALYVVQARGSDKASLERAAIIRDGFSWPAFIFAQLWLLYHRLWLALLVWIVLEIAFFLLVYPRVPGGTAATVDGLAHLFIGFEGQSLRITKAGRKATLVDVVEGRTLDEAEVRFFQRLLPDMREAAS